MKKINFLLFSLVFIIIILSGCGAKKVDMNQLSSDNSYHYENADLGFSVALPKEFIYFQTQRTNSENYTDLEIFVPTSDRLYAQEVSGYAKPLSFRIIDKTAWNSLADNDDSKKLFIKIGEKNNKIYLLKFWPKPPNDWQTKWTTEMEDSIVKSVKIQ